MPVQAGSPAATHQRKEHVKPKKNSVPSTKRTRRGEKGYSKPVDRIDPKVPGSQDVAYDDDAWKAVKKANPKWKD